MGSDAISDVTVERSPEEHAWKYSVFSGGCSSVEIEEGVMTRRMGAMRRSGRRVGFILLLLV